MRHTGDIRIDAKPSDERCIDVNFPETGEGWGRNNKRGDALNEALDLCIASVDFAGRQAAEELWHFA